MGAHTLIHKRTEDDIWKNLFELPLVETEKIYPKRNSGMSAVSCAVCRGRGADGPYTASGGETCIVPQSDLHQLLRGYSAR